MNGESRIRCSEGATETIFECLDGTLGCFAAMIVGFDELKCHLSGSQVSLYDFRGLIVNDVQFRRKSLQNEILKKICLSRKDVSQVEPWNRICEDSISFIVVHDEKTDVAIE